MSELDFDRAVHALTLQHIHLGARPDLAEEYLATTAVWDELQAHPRAVGSDFLAWVGVGRARALPVDKSRVTAARVLELVRHPAIAPPILVVTLRGLADVYRRLGEPEMALSLAEEALELAPDAEPELVAPLEELVRDLRGEAGS
jgi:tetratricopeptide (TPR) repeat protein